MSRYVKSPRARFMKTTMQMDGYGSIHQYLKPSQFKLVLPMILKNTIQGKGGSGKPTYPCVESMNLMINCLKLSDYNEAVCGAEVQTFNECYKKYNNDLNAATELTKKGIYKVDPNQPEFPVKFKQRLMKEFKNPTNLDNGPPVPPKHYGKRD